MSLKAVAWTLLAAMAFAAVLLFNYWASLPTAQHAGLLRNRIGAVRAREPDNPLPFSWNPQTIRRSAGSRGWCGLGRCSSTLAGPDVSRRAAENSSRRSHAGVSVFREAFGASPRTTGAGDAGDSRVNLWRHEVAGHAPENSRDCPAYPRYRRVFAEQTDSRCVCGFRLCYWGQRA